MHVIIKLIIIWCVLIVDRKYQGEWNKMLKITRKTVMDNATPNTTG